MLTQAQYEIFRNSADVSATAARDWMLRNIQACQRRDVWGFWRAYDFAVECGSLAALDRLSAATTDGCRAVAAQDAAASLRD